jgi:hypothetical protein
MMPLILSDPRKTGIAPTFYKLFHHRHQCKTCGLTHTHSEVFAMVAVQGSGFSGVPLHSLSDLQYNIPIKTETLPISTTPFCHICLNPDILKGLPKPNTASQRPPPPSWVGLGLTQPKPDRPKSSVRPPRSGSTGTPKPKTYTIDDLDID